MLPVGHRFFAWIDFPSTCKSAHVSHPPHLFPAHDFVSPPLTEVYRFCWHRTGQTTLPVIFWKQFLNIRYLLSLLRRYPNIEKNSGASKRVNLHLNVEIMNGSSFFLNTEIISFIVRFNSLRKIFKGRNFLLFFC